MPYAHTAAAFKALLEQVGVSQNAAVDELDVNPRTVRRWCNGEAPVPEGVWRWLEVLKAEQDMRVELALDILEDAAGEAEQAPHEVVLTYWRSQEEYDAHGREPGDFARVNALVRATAEALDAMGVEVRLAYWDQGATSIPGSRY
jgi:transcriptional regulator with XRE-family HTH domain